MNVRISVIFFGGIIMNTMSKNVNAMMNKVKRVQELRRSNAATPIPSKKKYSRKIKHKRRGDLTN
jgi:hypothetical protein